MISPSTFKIKLTIPRRVRIRSGDRHDEREQERNRDEFSDWLWAKLHGAGLLGIHEGTLLSEDASRQGLETESWTVDAGEAPRERDWIGGQDRIESELFFSTPEEAAFAAQVIRRHVTGVMVGPVVEQPAEDWDARWKASFLGAEDGFPVPPFWRILPPWNLKGVKRESKNEIILKINPGAGFGTGTHETTQLCMGLIGEISRVRALTGRPVLDFGSGSGILSIAAALLGGQVDGVEIDPLAIDNAVENAELNGVSPRVAFAKTFDNARPAYDLVIANILRPVLIEFSSELVSRMAPQASLVLSGLIEKDVAEVRERFSALLAERGASRFSERALGEWRALSWTLI
jgi:ribosomal protein L11 methyltransferase